MRTTVAAAVAVTGFLVTGVAFADDAKVAAGKQVVEAQKCKMCHSIEGQGNKRNSLDGVGSKLSDADIKLWLTDPKAAAAKFSSEAKPPMKSFANLPPADIDAVVAYVKSLKK